MDNMELFFKNAVFFAAPAIDEKDLHKLRMEHDDYFCTYGPFVVPLDFDWEDCIGSVQEQNKLCNGITVQQNTIKGNGISPLELVLDGSSSSTIHNEVAGGYWDQATESSKTVSYGFLLKFGLLSNWTLQFGAPFDAGQCSPLQFSVPGSSVGHIMHRQNVKQLPGIFNILYLETNK